MLDTKIMGIRYKRIEFKWFGSKGIVHWLEKCNSLLNYVLGFAVKESGFFLKEKYELKHTRI